MAPRVLPEIEFLELGFFEPRRPPPTNLLSVDSLNVIYGSRFAVRAVSLHVRPGEVVAIIGHNGCGKSSTLRAIFGLVPTASGTVHFEGLELTAIKRVACGLGIGFVPDARAVFADLRVHENLLLGAGPSAVPEVVVERLHTVLARYPELNSWLEVAAGTLSGGQQRIVSIALALMGAPRLLMLDEPTKHLAPHLVGRVLADVRELARVHGVGVLIAEVNVGAVATVADRVYAMRDGAIESVHTGAELLAGGPTTWWTLF